MWNLTELLTSDVPTEFCFIKIFVYITGWFLTFKIMNLLIEPIRQVIKGFFR
jgi:hypothetical protein